MGMKFNFNVITLSENEIKNPFHFFSAKIKMKFICEKLQSIITGSFYDVRMAVSQVLTVLCENGNKALLYMFTWEWHHLSSLVCCKVKNQCSL